MRFSSHSVKTNAPASIILIGGGFAGKAKLGDRVEFFAMKDQPLTWNENAGPQK